MCLWIEIHEIHFNCAFQIVPNSCEFQMYSANYFASCPCSEEYSSSIVEIHFKWYCPAIILEVISIMQTNSEINMILPSHHLWNVFCQLLKNQMCIPNEYIVHSKLRWTIFFITRSTLFTAQPSSPHRLSLDYWIYLPIHHDIDWISITLV